ncbi:hypothetical protein BBJ28_00016079 [Nothophytophthora sp. Chile5]|nr:hypothetical protein BBJ28_00016079 [Nothophytophthora sp. Chile5]
MPLVLDLVVPDSGSVATALVTILELSSRMKEGQDACRRLHARLQEIWIELQSAEERGQLPSSDTLDNYAAVVSRCLQFLQHFCDKNLVSRFLKHQEMMEALLAINEDVDMLFRTLDLAATAAVKGWKQQWETDRRTQEQAMAAVAEDVTVVLRDLQDTRAQTEAVLLLRFEIKQRAARQSRATMEAIKTMVRTIVRASDITVKKLPLWFLPPDEVKYESKPFARGSFGSVHKGVWRSDTKVVVKRFLVDDMVLDEGAQQQIEAEFNIWHQLNHPNVIKMFGASHVSSPPFVVCEEAAEGNLRSFLRRSDDNHNRMWRLLHQAALGLDYIHTKRVVHGHLKLSNILVGANGKAKLADFGLSALRTCSTLSRTVADAPKVSGGLRWRAPECLKRRPTFSSDVYSFAMCIIEAALGEPPFAFLDDDDVRGILKDGGIPDQPEEMSDDVWELVVSMTNQNPAKRITLPHVLEKLKVLADAEEAAEKMSAAETHCSACLSMIVSDSAFCDRCGAKVASEQDGRPTLDRTTSVAALMDIIATADAADTERALLLLVRKCIDSQERLQMYDANGIQVLSNVVKFGGCYVAQLYALESLSWATCYDSKLPRWKYEVLRTCVRAATTPELESMVDVLLHGTDQEKEDGLVLCTSLATRGDRNELWKTGVVPPLVKILRSGSVIQQLWATKALGNLSVGDDANRVAIARKGGISLLVALVRAGTAEQKPFAAQALGNLALNYANRVAIAREGGIQPLVALVREGMDEQKRWAAEALAKLAKNDANRVAIAREGGIQPLVALVSAGTAEQKRWATYALGNVAESDVNRVTIARNAGISPLVALVRAGSAELKRWAAYALGVLATNAANRVAIAREGGIQPLVALVRAGSAEQKRWAAEALGVLAINAANRVAIAREGGIQPLVALVRAGTDEQKRWAAYAMVNVARNEANRVAIAREGGIQPLVALVREGTDEQKRWAAYALAKLAKNDANRVAIAREGGIQPLVALVREGTAEQKRWAAKALAKLAKNDANRVAIAREGGIQPLVALVRAGTAEQKRWAAYALGVLATNAADRVAIAHEGGIQPLVALVRAGTAEQKRWAALALGNVALNAANRVAIARGGVISPLVALVSAGTDEQKQWAAYALTQLAGNNDANRMAIAREGAILPLVTLVKAGTDEQKQMAALALGILARIDANRVTIAREGGISPLVALVSAGTDEQKRWATYTIGQLAENDANLEAIACEGAIPPLVALVRAGTDDQKEDAACTLAKLARIDANRVAIAREGGISPLVALVRDGTAEQKLWAAYALGNVALNEANRVAIAREGGISPLVALAATETKKVVA